MSANCRSLLLIAVAALLAGGCAESTTTGEADTKPAVGARPAAKTTPAASKPGVDGTGVQTPVSPTETGVAATTAGETVNAQPAVVEAKSAEESPAGDSPSLTIGSPAPPLMVASWAKGDSVEAFKPGQVYVVEFWATWCGPCRTGMPHISEVQKHYGDKLTVIGVTAEDDETVQEFLKQEQSSGKTWDEVVQYTLAIDDSRKTNSAYMEAAGEHGIPTAFVVGSEGMIEWIGHPATIDEPLKKITEGRWDREQALIARTEEAAQQADMAKANQRLRDVLKDDNWNGAVDIIEELLAKYPDSLSLLFTKYNFLTNAGRNDDAAALSGTLVEKGWDEPMLLNQIAWTIVADKKPGSLETAEKAAQRAADLTESKDAAILDTLARVHFEQGHVDKAIEWQKKAIEAAGSSADLEETLKKYEGGAPSEESSAAAPGGEAATEAAAETSSP